MDETDPVAEALAGWLDARDRGERIDPEDVIRAHPALADQLRARFLAMDMVDHAFAEQRLTAGEIPKRIGEYRIVREVGRGGMGVVYEAEQSSMGRRVALKVLSPSFTGSVQAVQRFRREAHAAGRLHHTNLVPVYALGSSAGSWFYAMELVDGPSLAEVLQGLLAEPGETSRLGPPGTDAFHRNVALAFAGVAEALHLAHGEGIIHRDVKPSNLLFDRHGTLKLMDFGLARVVDGTASMTVSGAMLGTPYYMSPEQAAARRVPIDHRTDVYSLGATLYEAVTRRLPFPEPDLTRLCSLILAKEPPRPRSFEPRIPRDLETIILKAMEKEPQRRYATALDFARDLRSFAEAGAILARRVGLVGRAWRAVRRRRLVSALAAAAILAAAVGTYFALRAADEARQRVELQYAALLAQAEQATIRSQSGAPGETAGPGELYDRAISLAPDRPEAYLSRGLRPRASLEVRLADIDAAAHRGAPLRVIHLARAWVFDRSGDSTRAAEEQRLADGFASDDPRALLVEGVLRARAGDRRVALDLHTKAIERAPAAGAVHHLALRNRSLLYEELLDYAKALADLHALEAAGDRSVEVGVRIATLWRKLGQEAEATARFDLLRSVADHRASRHELCLACYEWKQFDWLTAVAADGLKVDPEDVRTLNWAARAHSLRNAPDEALRCCERALAIDPGSHVAWDVKASALLRLGRLEDCLSAAARAMEIEESCPQCHLNAGSALLRMGNVKRALQELRRAVELDSRHASALMVLGAALDEAGEFQAALEAYDQSILIDPRLSAAHYNRSNVLDTLKRPRDALAAVDEALRLEPENGSYHSRRGNLLDDLGETTLAFEAWDRAIALGYEKARRNKGFTLTQQGRYAEALVEYRRLAEAMPDSPDGHSGIAGVLGQTGKYEEALPACQAALKADPRSSEDRFNLTIILYKLERWNEMLVAVDEALALGGWTERNLAVLRGHRGRALGGLGNHEAAAVEFDKAIALGNTSRDIHFNAALFRHLRGQQADALAVLDRAVERRIESDAIHCLRGYLRLTKGDRTGALESLRRALELDPRCIPALQVLVADFARVDLERQLKEALEAAIRQDADDAGAARGLAWLLVTCKEAGMRDPSRALALANKAVTIAPSEADSWQALGAALCRADRWTDALKALEESTRLHDGGDASDWLLAALALHHSGRAEDALTHFDKASAWLREHPGNETLERLHQELAGLLGR